MMERQSIRRWLMRGFLLAVLSTSFAATWAQAPQSAKPAVAPPPTDLEPGVNTSATQTASPEPVPAPTTPARIAPQPAAASPTPGGSRAAAGSTTATGAATTGTTSASTPARTTAPAAPAAGATARTTAAPKSGAPAGKAQDKLELDATQITGNRELPKVLYIVPWKRSDLGDLVGKPVNSLLDEVLAPVDRDVFKRQNRYYDALKPDDVKDAAGAAAGATEKH
jgi:hypothetical protein